MQHTAIGNLKQPMTTSSFSSTSQVVKYQKGGCVYWTHSHKFLSAFTVAKRNGQSQERDAACSSVPPEFWMRSPTFAMLVVLWPRSAFRDLGGGSNAEDLWSLLVYSSSNRCMAMCCVWQQPAAMLSLAKTIGSRWLCPILP